MGFVYEHSRAWQLMKLTQGGWVIARQRLKELDSGCDDDGRVPEEGELPGLGVVEFSPMVMGGHHLFFVLAQPNKRPTVNSHRLVYDVGERQDHENSSQLLLCRRPQQMGHHCRGLSCADSAITREEARVRTRVAARLVHGVAYGRPSVGFELGEVGNMSVQKAQTAGGLQTWPLARYGLFVVASGVMVIGIN
jgi:hypothetical protein